MGIFSEDVSYKEHAQKIINIIYEKEKNPDIGLIEITIDNKCCINRYIVYDKYYDPNERKNRKNKKKLAEYIYQQLDSSKYSFTEKYDSSDRMKYIIREYDRAYHRRNDKLVSDLRRRMLSNDFVALILEKIKANIDEKDEITIGLDFIFWQTRNQLLSSNSKNIRFIDYGYPEFTYYAQINVLADIIIEKLDTKYRCSYATYDSDSILITATIYPEIRITNSW